VVPSRWENFPNVCMEAMGSGLPVITTRKGGMIEMIEDGRSGWIADSTTSEGLATALWRALQTPASILAEMGNEAAASIRCLCNSCTIVQRQLEFRAKLVQAGVPSKSSHSKARPRTTEGIAVIITSLNNGWHLERCLASVENQSKKFSQIVIVDYGST